MNNLTQLCGIVLLFVILILYFEQKSIDLRTRKVFLFAAFAALFSVALDMISLYSIVKADQQYGIWTHILCKSYLMSLIILGYASFRYITVDLNVSHILRKDTLITATAGGILGLILVAVTPINFYHGADGTYTYGISVIITYLFALSFLLANLVILFHFKKRMNPNRWSASLTWMCIWLTASAIQFCNNSFLLVGFASSIGIAILYIKLENPERYLDRVTGHFNEQALGQYMTQKYASGDHFSVLVIKLNSLHYLNELFGKNKIDMLQKSIADFFSSQKGATVFKHVEWEYSLIFETQEDLMKASPIIKEKFEENWKIDDVDVRLIPNIIEVMDSSITEDSDEMLEYIHYFIVERGIENKEEVLTMDRQWVFEKKEKERIEKIILSAIKSEQIEVYYQPIYSTEEEKFVSAEALVRIIQDDGTIVPPIVFIGLAEQNGLILQIGQMVFEKACRLIKDEKLWEKGIEYLEINLSAIQCIQENLADQLISIMDRVGVDPKMINLEITESAAIHSKEILLKNMNRLIEYGVSFSLDDFGTGYSNLQYILELPVKLVKFDRELTVSYFESERSKLIMEAAIQMIKAVGLKIVSEGVESKDQLTALEKITIDYIQGFYFSKPVNKEEFLKLISQK